MKVLAIIPARGGSKGVPGKNKRLLNSIPLVAYSIKSALECDLIDEVMVSTEDEEIAEISKDAGAAVPFLRPSDLARDSSPSIDVLMHVTERYEAEGEFFDAICLLQPTVPFRDPGDVHEALLVFREGDVDTLISMRPVPSHYHPDWVYVQEGPGVRLFSGGNEPLARRQDLAKAWHRDGSLYITRWDVLRETGSLYGDLILPFEMKRSPNINIDVMKDWEEAVEYVKRRHG